MDAERSGIKIVLSPYVLSFKDTIKYFKPELPFDFTVRTAGVAGLSAPVESHNGHPCLLCRSK